MTDSIEKALLLLCEKVLLILNKLEKMEQKTIPDRQWYDLRSLCAIKNVAYKTLVQKKYLQPNFGEPDIVLAGKKQWALATVFAWLHKSDSQLLEEYQQFKGDLTK